MPSVLHEVLRELFAKRPDLIAPLLERRLQLPAEDLIAIDSELTDPRLKQLLPDAVLACRSAEAPAVVVIVEVHLQIDEVKRYVCSGRHETSAVSWRSGSPGRGGRR